MITVAVVPASAPARNRAATVRPEAASSPRVPSACSARRRTRGRPRTSWRCTAECAPPLRPCPATAPPAPSCLAIRDATDHALLGVSCGQGGTPGGPYEVAFTWIQSFLVDGRGGRAGERARGRRDEPVDLGARVSVAADAEAAGVEAIPSRAPARGETRRAPASAPPALRRTARFRGRTRRLLRFPSVL